MEKLSVGVFKIGRKYWLQINGEDYYGTCVEENSDYSFTFKDRNDQETTVTSKIVEKFMEL